MQNKAHNTPSNSTLKINIKKPNTHISLHSTPACSAFQLNILRKAPLREAELRKKDKISKDYTLIYKSPIERYLSWIKNFSSFSALAVGTICALNAGYLQNLMSIPAADEQKFDYMDLGLIAGEHDVLYALAFFTLISGALRIFISKYPLRIYKKENKYLLIHDSQLPFQYRRVEFEQGQVEPAKPFLLNPWKSDTFLINNSTYFLLLQYFKTPSELYKMLKDEN